MSITNSREFTINVGKIAEAEKWLSEGADLWKEITGKDAVIYKEGWGDQYKMLFVTTYESMGETEEVGEKLMTDKRVTDWFEYGMTNGDFKRVYSFGTYDSDRKDIEYKGEVAFSGISFTFGAHRSEETIDAVGTKGNDTEEAYFLEANTSVTDELEFSGTVRQTDSDDFGSNTSYRTAAIYRFNNGVAFRAMGSSGFRAPSLYERYGAFGAGNINLKPEESETQEIGVEKVYQSGSSVRMTIFNTKVDNLIEYDMGTFSYTQATNSRKSQGIEFEGRWLASDTISVDGSYAYVDAKTGTEVAARVPGHDLSLSISANISPKINSNLEINHIMDYKDTVSGSLVDMPDYTVTNLAVSYDMANNLLGYVRVQDLMDTDYETVKDFNTGGRQIFAGIRATF